MVKFSRKIEKEIVSRLDGVGGDLCAFGGIYVECRGGMWISMWWLIFCCCRNRYFSFWEVGFEL